MQLTNHVRDFPAIGVWCGIMRAAENTITTNVYMGLWGGVMRGADKHHHENSELGLWYGIKRGADKHHQDEHFRGCVTVARLSNKSMHIRRIRR